MISFRQVTKIYPNGVQALKDLSLEVAEGELLVLLGTSGSGKTTAMKLVNRMVEPSSGTILVGGHDIRERDPIELRRSIGYAIQHVGLFVHMTVAENVALVPGLLGWTRERIDSRVDELLAMVGLEPATYRHRYPPQLSGGQRQRVGVARALAADPPVVLMDEPFGALDPITRETLQNEFLDLQAELKKTVIFVTHDVVEAVKLGDRIALLHQGRLEQDATPADLVQHPSSPFVEQFLGAHRFQLALMTRQVRSVLPARAPDPAGTSGPPPHEHIHLRDSLVDALDAFARAGRDSLPVYQGRRAVGELGKRELVEAMTRVIGQQGTGT
jgi:osmoprotectant transport system ATP-binding protein